MTEENNVNEFKTFAAKNGSHSKVFDDPNECIEYMQNLINGLHEDKRVIRISSENEVQSLKDIIMKMYMWRGND